MFPHIFKVNIDQLIFNKSYQLGEKKSHYFLDQPQSVYSFYHLFWCRPNPEDEGRKLVLYQLIDQLSITLNCI